MDGGERSGYWKGRDVEKYQRAEFVACLGRPRHMIWHPDDDDDVIDQKIRNYYSCIKNYNMPLY